jgi:hypothetical protein
MQTGAHGSVAVALSPPHLIISFGDMIKNRHLCGHGVCQVVCITLAFTTIKKKQALFLLTHGE